MHHNQIHIDKIPESSSAPKIRLHILSDFQKIAALESELGSPLLYRNNRGVSLTPKGEEFLLYSKRILSLVTEAANAVSDNGHATGQLRLGSLGSIAQTQLPKLLTDYHLQNKDVKLSITTGLTNSLAKQVLARELDGAFIAGHWEDPELSYIPYKKEKLLLATAKNSSVRSWKDIGQKTILVFPTGCFYRATLEALLRSENLYADDTITMDSLGSILANVCSGLGISVFPESVLSDYISSKSIDTIQLPQKYSQVETFFVYRSDTYKSTAFKNFLNCVSTTD